MPIFLYQRLLKPIMKPCCRFHPSCSDYSIEAIKQLGILKGGWLTLCRLSRCHPWGKSGYDPVSPNKEKY
ncbi:membrane protein insertion efficiency factor YidD [Legionella micdadei]